MPNFRCAFALVLFCFASSLSAQQRDVAQQGMHRDGDSGWGRLFSGGTIPTRLPFDLGRGGWDADRVTAREAVSGSRVVLEVQYLRAPIRGLRPPRLVRARLQLARRATALNHEQVEVHFDGHRIIVTPHVREGSEWVTLGIDPQMVFTGQVEADGTVALPSFPKSAIISDFVSYARVRSGASVAYDDPRGYSIVLRAWILSPAEKRCLVVKDIKPVIDEIQSTLKQVDVEPRGMTLDVSHFTLPPGRDIQWAESLRFPFDMRPHRSHTRDHDVATVRLEAGVELFIVPHLVPGTDRVSLDVTERSSWSALAPEGFDVFDLSGVGDGQVALPRSSPRYLTRSGRRTAIRIADTDLVVFITPYLVRQ